MARVSAASPLGTDITGPSYDSQFVELGYLLSRLQQTLLHPTPEREKRLRTSQLERTKVEANLGYARAALTRLEQNALSVKAPARRLETQEILNQRRETLELLYDRLQDLRHIAVEDDDSSEGEDLLGDIVPTPSESVASNSTEAQNLLEPDEALPESTPPEPSPAEPTPQLQPRPSQTKSTEGAPLQAPTQTSQTLRSRGTGSSQPNPSDTAHATARAALFASRSPSSVSQQPQSSTATAEAILDQQRAEQDALSDSILKMAGALKASSLQFSTALETDKDVVGMAGEGIEKTERGMEATRGRMGVLKRMTEGKGWWGRMILYAWVYGLMVALMFVVFVLPKFRF